jgi:ERCC4-type nuclease
MNPTTETLHLVHRERAGRITPVIVTDRREQRPLVFRRLRSVPGALYSGDYSIEGMQDSFAVEKKTVEELPGIFSTDRERFAHECLRLRGCAFRRLLVIGRRADVDAGRYHSKMTPRAILNSLAAFEVRYDLPIVWTPTPEAAALLVESWCYWFAREVVERCGDLLRATGDTDRAPTG